MVVSYSSVSSPCAGNISGGGGESWYEGYIGMRLPRPVGN